jgi:hypothetical protein
VTRRSTGLDYFSLVLRPLQFPTARILRVLDEQGLLIDDRQRAVDAWFTDKIADLPEPMRDQLGVWFLMMRDGSKTPPRRKPRAEASINVQLRNALPEDRNDRAGCGQALKSIFVVLKEHRSSLPTRLLACAPDTPNRNSPCRKTPPCCATRSTPTILPAGSSSR